MNNKKKILCGDQILNKISVLFEAEDFTLISPS